MKKILIFTVLKIHPDEYLKINTKLPERVVGVIPRIKREKRKKEMTREKRFPTTDTFYFYNANPKNKIASDCVVRAICTSTKIPYNEVLRGLYETSLQTGYMLNEKQCYEKYLDNLGYTKMKQPRKADNTKYTGKEWLTKYKNMNCIAHIGGHHIVAIVDGRVYDTWNSTDGCIGNYWVKEV